ncbi:MAG: TIGR00730 family Rossman fold protein [Nitrospirales bacterium]|nr:TIGR00730 family Rossman fold protein [Nitrospirales bacterium]
MKRVCVFCGSNPGIHPVYETTARQVGKELVARGIGLVYGAGNIGLMGIIANEVLQEGGEVIGVIPEFLLEKEIACDGLTSLHVVDSMHQRKALMADLSDAFVALPGGFGTLEEICEMITWSQLGLHKKPCGVLNIDGFFSALLTFFDRQVHEGFVTSENRTLVLDDSNPQALLDRLAKRI